MKQDNVRSHGGPLREFFRVILYGFILAFVSIVDSALISRWFRLFSFLGYPEFEVANIAIVTSVISVFYFSQVEEKFLIHGLLTAGVWLFISCLFIYLIYGVYASWPLGYYFDVHLLPRMAIPIICIGFGHLLRTKSSRSVSDSDTDANDL